MNEEVVRLACAAQAVLAAAHSGKGSMVRSAARRLCSIVSSCHHRLRRACRPAQRGETVRSGVAAAAGGSGSPPGLSLCAVTALQRRFQRPRLRFCIMRAPLGEVRAGEAGVPPVCQSAHTLVMTPGRCSCGRRPSLYSPERQPSHPAAAGASSPSPPAPASP